MKKIVLLSTLITPFFAHAQELTLRPNVIVGASNIKQFGGSETKANLFYAPGVEGVYMLSKKIGIGIGFNYGVYTIGTVGKGLGWNIDMSQTKIDVPLFLVYRPSKSLELNAGVINNVFASGKADGINEMGMPVGHPNSIYSKYTISTFVQVAGRFPLSEKLEVLIGPYFSYQITDNYASMFSPNGNYLIMGGKASLGISL